MGGKDTRTITPNPSQWRRTVVATPLGVRSKTTSYGWIRDYEFRQSIKEGQRWLHVVTVIAAIPRKNFRQFTLNKQDKERLAQFYREGAQQVLLDIHLALMPFAWVRFFNERALQNNAVTPVKLWQVLDQAFWYKNALYPHSARSDYLPHFIERSLSRIWQCADSIGGAEGTRRHDFQRSISHLHRLVQETPPREARDALNGECPAKPGEAQRVRTALERFLAEAWSDYGAELLKEKRLIVCRHCGRYAAYFRSKKYCSKNVDGRDCEKSARNARNYRRYRTTKLKDRREQMRLMRKHGIY
jgi:hypothetical protein